MLGHSFLWKVPRFLWNHVRGSCHCGLRMRGKTGHAGKIQGCARKEAEKEPQRFCQSGRAGKCSVQHKAGRRWAHSIFNLSRAQKRCCKPESLGRRFSCLNGYKSPLGQRVRENPLDWHSLNIQTSKGDSMPKTSSGLFVLSGLNKRQDDDVVLSNQRKD